MADSPDQRQLRTQKWTNCACELNKNIPYQSNKHRGYIKQTYPTLRYAFLARFGV